PDLPATGAADPRKARAATACADHRGDDRPDRGSRNPAASRDAHAAKRRSQSKPRRLSARASQRSPPMSSALAIAAVTAALKALLATRLLDHDLSQVGSVTATATPPDRVTTGANEPNQLNLFLYQVTPNLGWRNVDLPSRDINGARLTNAPLAIDLHYMLTAYGSADLNAEILLGYAMQMLHETPVITRAQLRTVLAPTSPVDDSIVPTPFGTMSA